MKMVEFPPATSLESAGGTYYTAPVGSAVAAKDSQVRQATLESSNVNPVNTVIEMITAQRQLETMRRALSMFNGEMDKTAAQDLPRVS
jgi:flagellar basal body rod protein FlgG